MTVSVGGERHERAVERRECGRCGAEVRGDKTRHFCGEPYPLRATDDIRTVRYVEQPKCPGCAEHVQTIERLQARCDEWDVAYANLELRLAALQPKCPKCEGKGQLPTDTYGMMGVDPCPRCGGSGYERMVALDKVMEWLEARLEGPRNAGSCVTVNLSGFEQRFGGDER